MLLCWTTFLNEYLSKNINFGVQKCIISKKVKKFHALIEIRVVSSISQVFQRSPFLHLCCRMHFDGRVGF